MPITINGSGTVTGLSAGGLPDDSIALADLSATGTASSSTFLRGDNSWAALSTGKILQVVSTTVTDTDSVSVATTAWGDLGPTRAITPSATDSKILIWANYSLSSSVNNLNIDARIDAGGSVITAAIGDAASNRKRGTTSNENNHSEDIANLSLHFVHSPSTTSAVTYKIQFSHNSSTTRDLYLNRCQADTDDAKLGRFTSTLTCMEIGA